MTTFLTPGAWAANFQITPEAHELKGATAILVKCLHGKTKSSPADKGRIPLKTSTEEAKQLFIEELYH